jgi:hypothetical protein
MIKMKNDLMIWRGGSYCNEDYLRIEDIAHYYADSRYERSSFRIVRRLH